VVHAVHELELTLAWKVPTAQFVHTVAPAAEYVPELQVNVQVVASPVVTE